MKQLTTRANRPLPHPQTLCSVLEPRPPDPPTPFYGSYCLFNRGWKAVGFGLWVGRGGGWGSIEGLACIHVFMVIMAAKRSTAWKVGLRLCSAGFTKSAKRGEPPQMVPSMSTERPSASGKLAHKKNAHRRHTLRRVNGNTRGHGGGRSNNRWRVRGRERGPKKVLPGRRFQYSLDL